MSPSRQPAACSSAASGAPAPAARRCRCSTPPTAACWRRSRAAAAADIDAAVAAAQAALDGPWGQLTAAERGRVLHAHVGQGAGAGRRAGAAGGAGRRQAAEAGPRRRRGAGALPRVLRRRGRQGDGRDHPLRQRLHRVDAARAAWRHRPHRALELPDADHRPQRRRGAGDGQCLRAQAGRGSLPDGAGLRAHCRRGRPARRRAERGARAWAKRPARRCRRMPACSTCPSPARSRWAR